MIGSVMLLSLSGLLAAAAISSVLAGTGRLRRNQWLGVRVPWITKSDATWRAGHRAGAPVLCGTAGVVIVLSLITVLLRSQQVDVDWLAWTVVILSFFGLLVALAIAGFAAYQADSIEFRWRSGPVE